MIVSSGRRAILSTLASTFPLPSFVPLRYFSGASNKTTRWGILSAGKISSDFAKAISVTPNAEIAAVAARSESKALSFAESHEIPKAYGSYQALLEDPSVDVIYVGSIADQHESHASQCLNAGKPVVVEKPLTLNYDATKSLIEQAHKSKTFLMEGMWTRCFPAMKHVRSLVQSGAIGRPITVTGDFGWSTKDCGPEDRIWSKESGGMTMDIAMYLAQLGQVAFPGATVERVQAMGTKKNGVDHTALASVQYRTLPALPSRSKDENDNGIGFLQFYVTGDANTEERAVIQGTSGRVVIDSPSHVPETIRLYTNEGRGVSKETLFNYPLPDDSFTTWNYPGSVGFTYEIQAVGSALQQGRLECPDYTWRDSLQVASILDEIRQQIREDDIEEIMEDESREEAI